MEEDEETRKYRQQIEKQKTEREKLLREKEMRRKKAAEEKAETGVVQVSFIISFLCFFFFFGFKSANWTFVNVGLQKLIFQISERFNHLKSHSLSKSLDFQPTLRY